MTDPVDTDALRAIAQGFDAKGWVNNAQHCRDAADEVDRLRAVELTAEGALAEQRRLVEENKQLRAQVRKIRRDGAHHPSCDKNSGRRYAPCTCWKADAL